MLTARVQATGRNPSGEWGLFHSPKIRCSAHSQVFLSCLEFNLKNVGTTSILWTFIKKNISDAGSPLGVLLGEAFGGTDRPKERGSEKASQEGERGQQWLPLRDCQEWMRSWRGLWWPQAAST